MARFQLSFSGSAAVNPIGFRDTLPSSFSFRAGRATTMVSAHPLPTDSSLPTLQSLTISRLTPGTRSSEDLKRRYSFASCCNHFGATLARRLLRLIAFTARATTGGLCIQWWRLALDKYNLSINEYLAIVLFYQSKFPIASTCLFVNFVASFMQIRAKAKS